MSRKRITWIDIARGIGILLVVYGHTLSADSFRYIIYAFHMPLFFLLSGLVFSTKPDDTYRQFITKNARNILIPYGVFALLGFILWYVTRQVSTSQALIQFGSIFYGNGNHNLLAFNNLLWFLPCLFLTRILWFIVIRNLHTLISRAGALLMFSIAGYLFSVFLPEVKLPFGLETALTAIVFLGAGSLCIQHREMVEHILKKYALVLFTLASILFVIAAVVNFTVYGSQVDMRQDRLHNYFLFYIAAFAGIIITIQVSMFLKQNRILEYLGKQSLVIFAWHLMLFPYVSKLLAFLHVKPWLSEAPHFLSPIVYACLSIALVLLIAVPIQQLIRLQQRLRHSRG